MGTIPITLAFTKTDDSKPALIAATDGYDREFYEGTLMDHKGDQVREFVIDVDTVAAAFGPVPLESVVVA